MIFFVLILGSLLSAFVVVFFIQDILNLILIFTIFTLINTLIVIWVRYRKVGLNDLLIFFTAIFIAYNVLFLLQVLGDIDGNGIKIPFFPIQFSLNTYLVESQMIFLASIGLLFSSLYPQAMKKVDLDFNDVNYKIIGFVGLLFFSLGVTLMFIDYQRGGGIIYLLTLPRVDRLALLSTASGGLPFAPLVFIGLSLLWIGFSRQNKLLLLAIVPTFLWILLMIIEGDRRYLLYSLMISISSYFSNKIDRVKINKQFTVIAIVIYITFTFFGQIRWLLQPFFRGELNLLSALSWIINNFSISWFLPGYNEFIGPNFTILYTLSHKIHITHMLFGSSYFNALGNLLPRSIYPGEKPLGLSNDFSVLIHDQYMSDISGVAGWGYSPITEALQNFGSIGVVFVFFFLGILLKSLTYLRYNRWQGILIYSLLVPQTFNLNRTDFIWVFQEASIFIIFGVVSILIIHFLNDILRHNLSYEGTVKKVV